MPPLLVALVVVFALVAVFWTTRDASTTGRKWALRIAGIVACYVLAGLLSGDPQAAAKSGELTVYLGIPAIVLYMIASSRAKAGARRATPRRR